MVNRKRVLESLKLSELRHLAARHSVHVPDRRVKQKYIEAILATRRITAGGILDTLSTTTLSALAAQLNPQPPGLTRTQLRHSLLQRPSEEQHLLEAYRNHSPPVTTEAELLKRISEIKKLYPSHRLLFRGQTNLYPNVRSGRARPGTTVAEAANLAWHTIVNFILDRSENSPIEESKALLQHYGFPTHFVDLTSDARVAAWFAVNKYVTSPHIHIGNMFRKYTAVDYQPIPDGQGYVLVLAIDDVRARKKASRLFDLSSLPPFCARPRAQNGWLLYDQPPTKPEPNDFWVATIPVIRSHFKSSRSIEQLFPGPFQDPAYARLLAAPFVQVPMAYFNSSSKKKSHSARHQANHDCYAVRAIEVPEYAVEGDDTWRHKWSDRTIYEPHPMRMWQGWHFHLSQVHDGIDGDVANSIKITLTPDAWGLMQHAAKQGVPAEWPPLGKNDLLFTFSAFDHDKVIDHDAPYHGVWLHRDDDLIIEHRMTSDHETLAVHPGHAYRLRNGKLTREVIPSACHCGNLKSHDERVAGAMALAVLAKSSHLLLTPHPTRIRDWYFALHPKLDFDEAFTNVGRR